MAVIILIPFSSEAKALSCKEPGSFQEDAVYYDLILSGEVISKKKISNFPGIVSPEDGPSYQYEFKVAKIWKGEVKENISILQNGLDTSWGYDLEVGEKVILSLVKIEEDTYNYPLCGFKYDSDDQTIIAELNEQLGKPISYIPGFGISPAPSPTPTTNTSISSFSIFHILLSLFLFLL